MFKEFGDPFRYLDTLEWDEIPSEIYSLVRSKQEEWIQELWMNKDMSGMSYNEWKSKFVKGADKHITQKHSQGRREAIKKREEQSGWKFKTIEEVDL